MGSVCCSCFRIKDPETNLDSTGTDHTTFFSKYATFFTKARTRVVVQDAQIQGTEQNDEQGRWDSWYSCEPDDEDVCPICLEEYMIDNPKIMLQCSHDYHLSCIYNWLERSQLCPTCDRVMLFDETS